MQLDAAVLNLFAGIRAEWLTFAMLAITYFGSIIVVGGLTFLSAVSFFLHGQARRIAGILISVGGSAATVYLIKNLILRARPIAEAIYSEISYSFPSGHAALAMSLYGFLIYSAWRQEKHGAKLPLILFLLLLIFFVGASRLYLGVHYFSDVIAGYITGFVWILISLKVSRSKTLPLPDYGRF